MPDSNDTPRRPATPPPGFTVQGGALPPPETQPKEAEAPAPANGSGPKAGADGAAAFGDIKLGHGGGGPQRRYRGGRDLTNGSIPKNLFHLSWPQVVEGAMNVADQMVDLVWAGKLEGGYRALAGVGVTQTFIQFGFMSRQGLDMALRAMVSRAIGGGDIALANRVALQGFTVTFAFSMLMVLIGIFLPEILLGLIGVSDAVKAEAAMYMRFQFIGMMGVSFRMSTGAVLQSAGDVMTPMKATMLTRVVHIIITPFLMFGWGFFPNLGLAGAGLANVLAQMLGSCVNFYALFSGKSQIKLTLRGYHVDWPIIKQMFKVGLPASVAGTERAVAQLVLLRLVTPFGDIATAAYAMTRRIEMFANFGSMGVGNAAGIMVGQNLGAGKPERAKASVWWSLGFVTVVKSFFGAALFLWPAMFIMWFTQDPEVVALTEVWVRIQVFAAIFMGMSMVYQQSYNTAGDTLAPMLVTLITVWLIELPLAWFLAGTSVGVLAIGWAGLAAMAGRIVFYVPYFFHPRWLRIKVY